jgi:3-oxoacyl-[acyl-carrier-protein] synthase-1
MTPYAPDLRVVAAGAVTSVGNTLPTTSAALLAALDHFADRHFRDEVGEPIPGASFTVTNDSDAAGIRVGGAEKLGRAVAWAVEECLRGAGIVLPLPAGVPLLFLGDDTRPAPLVETAHLCHAACARFFAEPQNLHMQAFTAGEVGCVQALRAADQLLADGAPYVVIAAVDTWLRVPDITQGLRQRRLLVNGNAFGFVPGEGAAAILLAGPQSPLPTARRPQLRLLGLGLGEESATLLDDVPCYGRGMAGAIRDALAQAGWAAHDVHLRLSDCAGEAYFSEELSYAWGRVLREAQPLGNDYIQVATRIGHVGAAFGPLLLAHLWQLAQWQKVPGPRALIHLSSAQSARGTIAAHIE